MTPPPPAPVCSRGISRQRQLSLSGTAVLSVGSIIFYFFSLDQPRLVRSYGCTRIVCSTSILPITSDRPTPTKEQMSVTAPGADTNRQTVPPAPFVQAICGRPSSQASRPATAATPVRTVVLTCGNPLVRGAPESDPGAAEPHGRGSACRAGGPVARPGSAGGGAHEACSRRRPGRASITSTPRDAPYEPKTPAPR
jgi:hypothetical protein